MKRISFFAFGLLLFTASLVLGQKVAADWDHDADFSKYETYAWIESQNPGSELAAKRIALPLNRSSRQEDRRKRNESIRREGELRKRQ